MIRDYTAADRAEIRRIHYAMELDYKFPDLENPLFLVKKVAEKDGKPFGALALRICAEAMLWLDKGHPKERYDTMKSLQDEVMAEAYLKGLSDVFADVPNIRFDKRLKELGWEPNRPGWALWSRSTK